MKRIVLKKLKIENFKGCRDRTIDFGSVTDIYGANASGKSTVKDAFLWLMFDKNGAGATKFSIRPRNGEGKDINNVEIIVEATLEIDGVALTLQKVQKQNWVKKRGTDSVKLQGNVNTYEVNGFPASEKEFKGKIASVIDEKLFWLLIDPRNFPALPWKEQRAILTQFVPEISDSDVLESDADTYRPVADEVLAAGVEKATEKAKKAMATLKEKQKALPTRIDEASKSLVQIPELADLELQRNALNEQLEEVQKQRDDAGQVYKVAADIQAEIMQTKLDIGGIEQAASEKLDNQRRESRGLHSDLESKVFDLFEKRQKKEGEVKRLQAFIEEKEKERAALATKWRAIKAETMDESEKFCEKCGQALPEDRIQQIVADHEKNKKDRIAKVSADGCNVKAEIDNANDKIEVLQKEIAILKQQWNDATGEKNRAYEAMNAIPDSVDISDNQEYQALQTKLSNLETQLGNMDTGESFKQQLSIRERGIREELDAVNKQFAAAENNERTQARIDAYMKEQRTVGQQVADQEKKIFLLEKFSMQKMDMLTDKINRRFNNVRFRLFTEQINGGINPTCVMQANSNGAYVDYEDANDAGKMQAGLEVICAMTQFYDVSAPVFLDNRESVTKIPEVDGQIINLFVSPVDKELRVEVA